VNYLYLSQNLEDAESPEKHQALLLAIANGSISVWRHINMIGEYDFSDEKAAGFDRYKSLQN